MVARVNQTSDTYLSAVQQQDRDGYYLVVDLPGTGHVDAIGSTTVPIDALPCDLIRTLDGLRLAGATWFGHPVVAGTERRIYALQLQHDLMDAQHPLATLLSRATKLLEQAREYATSGCTDIRQWIAAPADRALLYQLARIKDAGGTVQIALGTSGRTILEPVETKALASIKAPQTIELIDEPVTGLELGVEGRHTFIFENGKRATVAVDEYRAREIIGTPHRFTGCLTTSGSTHIIDASRGEFTPWSDLASARPPNSGHTPSV